LALAAWQRGGAATGQATSGWFNLNQSGGQSDMHAVEWRSGVASLGEKLCFWTLVGASDNDVLYVPEGIIEVKLPASSATFRGNPTSMDQMMAVLLRRYLLGGIIRESCVGQRN
jgi:hypothetical protein